MGWTEIADKRSFFTSCWLPHDVNCTVLTAHMTDEPNSKWIEAKAFFRKECQASLGVQRSSEDSRALPTDLDRHLCVCCGLHACAQRKSGMGQHAKRVSSDERLEQAG